MTCVSCCPRKGDLTKCILFYIIGAVFLLAGIPLMIVGIVGTFRYSDFIGYVGGFSIFFGVLFWFVWYMLTIPNIEKMKLSLEDIEAPDATREAIEAVKQGTKTGFNNPVFVKDRALPGKADVASTSSGADSDASLRGVNVSCQSANETDALRENKNNSNDTFLWEDEILSDCHSVHSLQKVLTVTNGGIYTTSNTKPL